MAVVQGPFDPRIIKRLKGTLDFYTYRGIYCVRAWPRKPAMPRSLPVQNSAATFAATAKALSEIPAELQELAKEDTKGTLWTWRDVWTSALYGNQVFW